MAKYVPLVVQGVLSGADLSSNPGHFLLPRAERARLPAPPSPPCNVKPIRHGELQVEFKGWPVAPELWKAWVDKPLWQEAGILHAILATTLWVERDEGALLQLAAFWSGDTNMFVFPWGEATVTLEDDLSALRRYISSGDRSRAPFVVWATAHPPALGLGAVPGAAPGDGEHPHPCWPRRSRCAEGCPPLARRPQGARPQVRPRGAHVAGEVRVGALRRRRLVSAARELPPPGHRTAHGAAILRALPASLRAGGHERHRAVLPAPRGEAAGVRSGRAGSRRPRFWDQFAAWANYRIGPANPKVSFIVPRNEPAVTAEYEQWWEPCSRACAAAVAEAARMKVHGPKQIAETVKNDELPGWVRSGAKRTALRKGKKVSQGSSCAAAILMSAVDGPSASVAEKEQSSKSLQQQGQEEAPQPVTMPDEQGSISEQAEALIHQLVKQTQTGATASLLQKAGENMQPVSTGNNEQGNPALKVDISELASALKNLTLQLEPAAGAAAVMKGSTKETGTPAVTGEMGKRALKGKSASLGGNNKGTNNDISSPNQQMESLMKHRSEANKKRSGNGGTSSSRTVGEETAQDSPEVCTKTLYYLSRSDRSEDDWAKDANRSGDSFQPRRAVGTMKMIEKASTIRRAEIAELRETIRKQVEELRAQESAEERERLNRKK